MAGLIIFSRNLTIKGIPLLCSGSKVNTFEQLCGASFQAYLSTSIVGENPVLVRDFIHSALYDPNYGYFPQRSGSVGVLERGIKFNQLQGRKAYMKYLDKIYKQNDIAWFTPVELFKPWYAHGIAEAIMRTANLSVPLKIYEIGGGSGTCAKGIMDYIMLNAPAKIYSNMTYTSVEISPSLAERQRETVGEVRTHLSKFKVECRDAADPRGWGRNMRIRWRKRKGDGFESLWANKGSRILSGVVIRLFGHVDQQPCWVIMLEVLDNLPHDLIYSENQTSSWMETWVEKQLNKDEEKLCELYKPLQDPLIQLCLDIIELDHKDRSIISSAAASIWSKVFPKPRRCWLPTGCLKLLGVLHSMLPKMSLIASDFSFLPDVTIPGARAPLVSTKRDGTSSDYESYLDAKGDADIFFPTDFWLLERIDHYCSGWLKLGEDQTAKQGRKRRTITLDTSSFMEEFGLPSKTRTLDGYNPLLDDFKNTKFYLSVPTHNIK